MDDVDGTTSAILASAAGLLRQRTFEDIAYAEVAEQAEVSERTMYRRFPTRSHLLEALARWIEREHFPLGDFDTADGLCDVVRERLRSFDAEPAYAFVAARGAALSPTDEHAPSPMTAAIEAMIVHEAPALNRRDARRISATLGYFASPMFWARMRAGFDMSATEMVVTFDSVLSRTLAAATPARSATS